jgi:FKBP-type peptidyl-prolyl cis-trans isomerase (trigger factor)
MKGPLIMLQNLQYKHLPITWHGSIPSGKNINFETTVLQSLAANNDFPILETLIEQEMDELYMELDQQRHNQLFGCGDYKPFLPDETAKQDKKIRIQAHINVKIRMVLQYIIEAEHLTISSEELEQEVKAMAKRQNVSISEIKDFMGSNLEPLKRELLTEKAIRLIMDSVVIQNE